MNFRDDELMKIDATEWLEEERADTDYVRKIIMETKEVLPEHWKTTLSNRTGETSLGSYYSKTSEEIEKTLLISNFKAIKNPNISPDCEGFITHDLFGFTGLLKLSLCNPNDGVLLEANKGGFLSCVIEISRFAQSMLETYQVIKTEPTVLIIGEHNGEKVVFTFHAGDPVTPSEITGEERTVRVEEAIEMGFDYAKIRIIDWFDKR